jgi:hypothetical protein
MLAGDKAIDTIINKSLRRQEAIPLRRRRAGWWN